MSESTVTYTQVGDYFIPDLILPPEQDSRPIGIWGAGVRWTPLPKAEAPTEPAGETMRRRTYLQEFRKVAFSRMVRTNTLHTHLADVNEQAEELFYRSVKQLAEQENITEQLKSANPMLWVQSMNKIRHRVEELIYAELIYV